MLKGMRARLAPKHRRLAFFDRKFNVVDLKAISTACDWFSLGCSTIAIADDRTPDRTPGVAHNFDSHGFRSLLDNQVALCIVAASVRSPR